jgi:16S rRNA (uracil1498-N3)-methyltransferase
MRRFYAPPENFRDGKILLGLEETRHLRDVLRLRAGANVNVFDGAGAEFSCAVEKIGKSETVLEILAKVNSRAPESGLDLSLAVALLKGEKFDLVVQKAVELGVNKLIPLKTARADVKIKDAKDAEKKIERWRRIALEAAKQCGRARLMKIEAPLAFEEFLKNSATQSGETFILFSERGGDDADFAALKPAKKMTAAIGAEGGWEDAEIERARAGGFQIITLGGRVLRAETAAISIAAVLQHRFGDLK